MGTGFRDCADCAGQPDNGGLAAQQLPPKMSQNLSLTFKTTGTTISGIAPTALANLTMTGSLPYNFPPNMTPTMGARDASQSLDQSSGYPSPRHLTQPFSNPPAKHVPKAIVFFFSLFTSRLLLLEYHFKGTQA
jgi:hypothetical protein